MQDAIESALGGLGGLRKTLISSLSRRMAGRVDAMLAREYRQIDALVGLYSTLDVRLPLPAMRGSAVCSRTSPESSSGRSPRAAQRPW